MEISIERYTQLIRAEHDANQIKTLLKQKLDTYGVIDREDLRLLVQLYCGEGEE